MPQVLDDGTPPRGKIPQKRGKYPWDEWFAMGDHLLFTAADHKGTSVTSFRQALYNAAGRRKLDITAPLDKTSGTIEVWIIRREDNGLRSPAERA